MAVSAERFVTAPGDILRSTLRRHAAGVTVVTVPGPAGFTATSFTSVSLEPALVSFCLGTTASTAPAVRAAGRFAVHILGADEADLAGRFATSGIDRFAGVQWRDGGERVPVLDGVPAWLVARVRDIQEVGDHLFVVGEVEAGEVQREVAGLVHQGGVFGVVARQ